ncbi:Ig-like domain-containing protein [Paenibacillus apiarius]|uniref:Ig-like domain-containing protein n=1 Tax=Paenibacillus apiarius TaxID=46240 RepID=UPI00197DD603|nr:Ig-like domain-containing protein [Paenibacillus apiarius]MBN3523889.1 Ig-like domain-containing protein [Paenibacillus apiarius]
MKKWLSALLVIVLALGTFGWGPVIAEASPSATDTAPAIIATTPANGQPGVSANPAVSFTFNQNVKIVNGNVTVTQQGTGNKQIFNKDGGNGIGKVVSSDLQTYQLEGLQPLQLGATYEVSIDPLLFISEGTNEFYNGMKWSFTVKPQPGIERVSPQQGVAPVNPKLEITFKQPVQAGTGSIRIIRYSNNNALTPIPASSFTFDPTGLVASYQMNESLEAGTSYYVTVDAEAFKDAEGTPVEGFLSADRWHFETERGADTTPPVILSRVPERNAVSPLQSRIEMTFSKPVFQEKGDIVVKSDGKPDVRIPVTSAIVGGGTAVIKSVNTLTFEQNRTYTVTVPEGAFRDQAGNLMKEDTWSFRAQTIDTSAPTLSSYDPYVGSTGVSTSKTLTATFNKPIAYSGTGVELRRQNQTTSEKINVTTSGRELRITPVSRLQDNMVYTVNIARGAVKDSSGNEFAGASNWTFSTSATDRTAPVVESVKLYNNTLIEIRYNKSLDSSVNLPSNEFTVTVNNGERKVNNAYTSGNNVYVSLESGVAVGQDVKISYAARFRMVRDTYGNVASSFGSRAVENKVDSSLSKIRDATIYGDKMYVYFTESLKDVSSYAGGQFTVTYDGSSVGIDKISNSGSGLYLTMNRSVSDGEVVKISYTPGSYPLEDRYGIKIDAFEGEFVRNTKDKKPPELTETNVISNKLTLIYNKALDKNSIPLNNHYSVLVNDKPRYVTKVEIKVNRVELTLQSAVSTSDTVTVSYVRGYPALRDLNGNLAPNLNLVAAGNVTDSETPVVQSANWSSPSVVLTFNKKLESMQASSYGQFYVRAGNQLLTVKQVTVKDTKVTIELVNPPAQTDALTVSYNTGSKPIKSTSGVEIKPFSNKSVTVGLEELAGANFVKVATDTSFIDSMIVLLDDVAQKSSDRTSSGQVVNRYTLDQNKLKTAFQFLSSSSGTDKQLMYEVPSSESAARVAVPLSAFDSAYISKDPVLFAIKYGNTLYGINISRDSIIQVVQNIKGSLANSSLLIEIEPAQSQGTNIQNTLGRTQSTALVQGHRFTVFGYTGGNQLSGMTEVKMDTVIKMRTTDSVTAGRTAIVEYQAKDNQLSYIPTKLTRSGVVTVAEVRAKQSMLAVFAIGNKVYMDIPGHWAQADMTALSAKMIMDGRGSTKFEPNNPITRQEFAVSISKALGLEPSEEAAKRFRDINSSTLDGAYIGAAVKAGIITGFPDGTFKPNDSITREQITLMMVRAAQAAGHRLPNSSTTVLSMFKDSKQITTLGAPTVAQAVQAGLIQGVSKDKFQPKGSATRAQAAVLLRRLLTTIDYITLEF